MTETEKKIENLKAINNWCKDLMSGSDKVLYVDNAYKYNGRAFRISVSKNGIGAKTYGKFSYWSHVNEDVSAKDNLLTESDSSEIVYNWKEIKQRILRAKTESDRRHDAMMNFTV